MMKMWIIRKEVALLVFGVAAVCAFSPRRRIIQTGISGIRPGQASYGYTCWWIRRVPNEVKNAVGLSGKYKKYTEAYRIPIVSTGRVRDDALTRACYLTAFLFASRMEIRKKYYEMKGFIEVVAENEFPGRIPSYCAMPVWWTQGSMKNWHEARDVEPSKKYPITTIAEENLLCSKMSGEMDWYAHEEFSVHMMAHTLQFVLEMTDDRFEKTLKTVYKKAMKEGLWNRTYAARNEKEYFAEGVQSYLGVNVKRKGADGVHNGINGRSTLKRYDLRLYNFIRTVLTCDNVLIKKCDDDFVETRVQKINQCGRVNPEQRRGCYDISKLCKKFTKVEKWCYKKWVALACQKSCKMCKNQKPKMIKAMTKKPKVKVAVKTTKKPSMKPAKKQKTALASKKPAATPIRHPKTKAAKKYTTPKKVTSKKPMEIFDAVANEVTKKPLACQDRSKFCRSLARNGKCLESKGNILTICPLSCNICACEDYIDIEANCTMRRVSAEACNTAYMEINCQKTCNKCPGFALETLSKFIQKNSCQAIKSVLNKLNM